MPACNALQHSSTQILPIPLSLKYTKGCATPEIANLPKGAVRTLHTRAVVTVLHRHGRQLDLLRYWYLILPQEQMSSQHSNTQPW